MAKLPYMKLYVQDILTSCQTMTPKEFGVHCRLLFQSWIEGGELPEDAKKLYRVTGLSGDRHAKDVLGEVLSRWQVDEGKISHKRVTDSYEDAVKTHESYQIRGSKGGHAKASSAKAEPKPSSTISEVRSQKSEVKEKTETASPSGQPAQKIWTHYKDRFQDIKHVNRMVLTDKLKRHIKARLSTFSEEDLIQAVNAMREDINVWPDRVNHCTLDYVVRSDDQVVKWLSKGTKEQPLPDDPIGDWKPEWL